MAAPTSEPGSALAEAMQQFVALLQELLAISSGATQPPPLSRSCALLVGRLPVDWAALAVVTSRWAVVFGLEVCCVL